MKIRVAVLGAGSWGTTFASLAAHNAETVLWSRVLTGTQANRRTRPAKPRYDFSLFDGLVNDAREGKDGDG